MNNETIPQFGAVRYLTGQDTWFSANPGDKDYAVAQSLATEYYESEWLPVGNLQGLVSQQQYLEFCLLHYKSKSGLRFGQSFIFTLTCDYTATSRVMILTIYSM